jgi:hypothetical protein
MMSARAGVLVLWTLSVACTAPVAAVTHPQADAAAALIGRIVGPDRAAAFNLTVSLPGTDGRDWFAVAPGLTSDGQVAMSGTSGVALASGFNWYLMNTVGRQISYPLAGEPFLDPASLPAVGKGWPIAVAAAGVRRTSQFKYR